MHLRERKREMLLSSHVVDCPVSHQTVMWLVLDTEEVISHPVSLVSASQLPTRRLYKLPHYIYLVEIQLQSCFHPMNMN